MITNDMFVNDYEEKVYEPVTKSKKTGEISESEMYAVAKGIHSVCILRGY